jgi:GTPase SAR1 family protein
MAAAEQPSRKSYFFGKGYRDLGNTIADAWLRNFQSIGKYKDHISHLDFAGGKIISFFGFVINGLAILAVFIFGSAITLIMTLANIIILLSFMLLVYAVFSLIWTIDRIYLIKNKIFTACHECKEKSLIPTYLCPKCGAKHTNLTPGVYGILKHTCTGNGSGPCGAKLPAVFFNGRRELQAECPHCGHPLMDRETVPLCIPVVGGRSAGKTAFITAFSRDFIEEVAGKKKWEIIPYNSEKSAIYSEILKDYNTGSTRMTERSLDRNKASSVSFSFFIKAPEFNPERLIHIYDIAGEVFTYNNENEVQKQYEYCHGIVFVLDPFAIPAVRYKYEHQLSPEDIAGIGSADINGIINSFLNKLREVTGLQEQTMSSIPLALVINKIDSGGIGNEIGKTAVTRMMKPGSTGYGDFYDTQDYLCRKFLIDNGMEGFLNNITVKFRKNRFFACSAIGHSRDRGAYRPEGVMPAMQWLFNNADTTMLRVWNDINFSGKPFALN